ncbi:hypothetical protein J2S03_001234 [Alicyclobacillus cycloheptanicus]|uniref:Uncharacterized protein n=1 Tax=Alicyclobacillus cycloheptanicus TaxID=1457 RepID=A0ABT9XGI7_9BACL|nr:hypothetical protein [Alicyclobacillus cycloheptanicus]
MRVPGGREAGLARPDLGPRPPLPGIAIAGLAIAGLAGHARPGPHRAPFLPKGWSGEAGPLRLRAPFVP